MLSRIGRSYPAPASQRAAVRVRNEAMYHSATTGRRARHWYAPTAGPNDSLLPNLSTLRARSRAGVRNDGYARTSIDRLVSNIVGAGIEPQSLAPDQAFQEAVEQLWLDWTDVADADGMLDFYGLQALAVREWLEGGEVFTRLRPRRPEDGLVVPLQLHLLESELCPVEHTVIAPNGNRIRAGIEVSPINRRTAYWFYRQRPGEPQDLNTAELVRVPAEGPARGIHLFDPLRGGQIRGGPQLTQALLKLYDLDKFDDATLLRQQLANLFVAFMKRTGPAPEPGVNPMTGRPVEQDAAGRDLMPLEPGIWQELYPDEAVEFSDPPDAGGYEGFMRAQLMGAAVAADVPYEVLTGDLRAVNDRTVRVILNEFRRRIEQRQHHVVAHMFNRPIWEAFIQSAIRADALQAPAAFFIDPRPWFRVEWVPPAWPYLHPVQDVEAERAMVLAGFKSRTQVTRERGWRARQVEREIHEENQRADEAGLRLHSDSRHVDAKGASARPAGDDPEAPAPEPRTENA